MNYPTVLKTGALKEVFGKIKATGTPPAFTTKHLKSLGFTSSNDVAILSALRFVGFIDSAGKPGERYKNYKGSDGQKILAEGIKNGYSELFALYPDAEQKDEESLMHFFATNTDVSESSRKVMVSTFRTLCSMADFKSAVTKGAKPMDVVDEGLPELPKYDSHQNPKSSPAININIELQIPPTNDPEVYKNFFEAMKKYLFTD